MPKYLVRLFTLYGEHEYEANSEGEAKNMMNFPELDPNDPVILEAELVEPEVEQCQSTWTASDGSAHWCQLNEGHEGEHRCCVYSSDLKELSLKES